MGSDEPDILSPIGRAFTQWWESGDSGYGNEHELGFSAFVKGTEYGLAIGRREAFEAACRAICQFCEKGLPVKQVTGPDIERIERIWFQHETDNMVAPCRAEDIRRSAQQMGVEL